MDFKKIERKWQKRWEEEKIFEVKESAKKKKFYVLDMFPYPSGAGLHIGHAFVFSLGDIFARFKRMQGHNVLYPIGYDSLGLPAENAAIEAGTHPEEYTKKSIANFMKQQKAMGWSYDWSRAVKTSNPEFYRWDQWIFLKMLEKGLAYRKKAPVNWCRKCDTVLANEQVIDGKCWRHEDTEVEIKNLEQWFLKITDYAEELLEGLDKLDWPDNAKKRQRNWIGKSYGTDIYFEIDGSDKVLPTYTTRCDTIFSVTFLAIAPESPLVNELVEGTDWEKDVKEFAQKLAKESLADRINEEKEKVGIFTGRYAVNPVNGERVPIYVANFALTYGSGVVMCDAHDKRDFRFARKYDIPLKFVISKDGKEIDANREDDAFVDDGILFNSGEFSGMKNREALPKMADWIEKKKWGKKTVNYKLRDWLISRQRYWGTPIPIIYCDKCGVVPIPEKDLPVKLPKDVKFGKGNPLKTNDKFVHVKCPKCKSDARRETDTMDTFANSSWYFLRYADPRNDKKIFDEKKANYWAPIDQYIGGPEHITGHLIYFRFYTKFLRDLGLLKFDEPALRYFTQGIVHGADGEKMSKSRGNVIEPLEMIKKFGADTLRLALVSFAGPDKDSSWDEKIVVGNHKFLKKVYEYFDGWKPGKTEAIVESKLNKTVKEVTDYIQNFKHNLAAIKLRNLFNSFVDGAIDKKSAETFLKLLHVYCPFVTEELWEKMGNKPFVSLADWPKFDGKKINEKFDKIDAAVDKTISDVLNILKIVNGEKIYVYVLPNELENYDAEVLGKRVGKEVRVFAVNDAKKYDPLGKSAKVKPGRPAIYVE
ncbi:MAG: leucine--tRNA ligase [Nanoarchaeota archaeon]|nr:leucine--tRNA ligase [Nanoarchaeota archaeon]